MIRNKREDYGEEYNSHLLEQYHFYINGIDKVSDRRQKTNDFFLALNTGAMAFIGVMNKTTEDIFSVFVVVSIVGIILSVTWFNLIKSYKKINKNKYIILHKMEEHLPASPFKTEWQALTDDNYKPVTQVEISVPIAFTILYLLIIGVIFLM